MWVIDQWGVNAYNADESKEITIEGDRVIELCFGAKEIEENYRTLGRYDTNKRTQEVFNDLVHIVADGKIKMFRMPKE